MHSSMHTFVSLFYFKTMTNVITDELCFLHAANGIVFLCSVVSVVNKLSRYKTYIGVCVCAHVYEIMKHSMKWISSSHAEIKKNMYVHIGG
jgi:hypothetical protein